MSTSIRKAIDQVSMTGAESISGNSPNIPREGDECTILVVGDSNTTDISINVYKNVRPEDSFSESIGTQFGPPNQKNSWDNLDLSIKKNNFVFIDAKVLLADRIQVEVSDNRASGSAPTTISVFVAY